MAEKKSVDKGEKTVATGDFGRDSQLDSESQSISNGTLVPEALVDGGYGWVCVIAVAFINAHTWGISVSYSVFLSYYATTGSLQGATSLNYAVIAGLQMSQAFMIAPLATKLIGAIGCKQTLFVGSLVQLASLIGASFATQIWQLYLGQAVGFGWGMGLLFVAVQNIIPQWFTRRRGFANGIASTGTGLGALLWSFMCGYMLTSMGVGWAIRVLAIVSGAVNLIASAIIKDRRVALDQAYNWFDIGLFRRKRYLMLLAYGFLISLGEMVVLTQIPTFASSVLELDTTQASTVGAMVGLGQILGRFGLGYVADRFGRLNMGAITPTVAGLLSLAVWINAHSFGLLVFYSIGIGAFAGVFWSMISPISAEVMGIRKLPDTLSTLFLVLVLPTTVSPLISVELVRFNNGSFLGAQLYTGCTFLAAAVCAWLLRGWRVAANEKAVAAMGVEDYENPLLREQRLDLDDLTFDKHLFKSLFKIAHV